MKKIFAFLLVFMLLVPTVQAETTEDGIAFTSTDDYRAEKIMTELPVTIEAEFKLPEGQTERAGVIVGNYIKQGHAGLTIEILSNGIPRVYYLDNAGTIRSYQFSDVNVCTGEWVHMTIVFEASEYCVYCYIDGTLAQTLTSRRYSTVPLNFRDAMVIGGDNRLESDNDLFNGRIREVLIYDDMRTAAEIASDAEAATIDTSGLIAGYSLKENADGTNPERITDLSGNGYDLVSSASWAEKTVTIDSYAYSMAVVGDTQMLINDAPLTYSNMIDWIEDGADTKNTKHVFTLGNYALSDTAYNYAIADAKLFNLGVAVPYSVVRGYDDTTENYNLSFKKERHGTDISGAYDDTMLNTYTKFDVGNVKYMTINLDFEASEDVLNWASALCTANSDRNVIVSTFENVLSAAAANGQNFKDMLINKHSNISLVISRDYLSKKVQLTTETGTAGNTVTYLAMPRLTHANYSLSGLVGMLYFSEDGKNVQFRYYSTAEDKYFMDDNQFEFTLNTVAQSSDSLTDFTVTAQAETEPEPEEPTEYTVTINSDENANIVLTDAVVEAGESTTFTVTPKSGYYIKSITVGGTAIDVTDAYNGGTYNTGAINADTKIVVTMAAIPTVDAVFDGGLDSYPAGYTIAGKTAPSGNPTILSGGTAQTVTIVNENGNNVASVSGSTINTITFPDVPVTVGETYDFSADVYVNGEGEEADGYIQVQLSNLIGGTGGNSNFSNVTYTAANGTTVTSATSTTGTLHMQSLPYNTWIHVEGTVAPTYEGQTAVDSSVNFKFMNSSSGKVDNVSLTKSTDAWNINLTEANDFGAAYVKSAIEKTETTKLIVTPITGYGIHSVTLDGTPIALRRVAKDTRSAEENTWYYTINGADLTADANIVVTYAQYTGNLIDMLNGAGDAEDDITTNTNIKGASGVSVTTDSTYKNGGDYSFKADGSANSADPRLYVGYETLPVGEYILKFDVYSPSDVTGMRINSTGSTTSRFALVDNWYISDYDLPTAGAWKSYSLKLDVFKETSGSVSFYFVNTDYVAYYDNVQILKKELAAPVITPATAAVTISGANAVTSVAAGTVTIGTATTFTVSPKFGYYIQSITVGGTAIDVLDAYKGGTYSTGEISADTAIVVTTASLSDSSIEGVSNDVATLPAVFAPAADSAVTFGKVLDTTATEYGIYLTKGTEEVTTATGAYGPYFAAKRANGNGQFAVEFVGLEAGTYTAKTYVKVGDAYTYGVATTITIAE